MNQDDLAAQVIADLEAGVRKIMDTGFKPSVLVLPERLRIAYERELSGEGPRIRAARWKRKAVRAIDRLSRVKPLDWWGKPLR